VWRGYREIKEAAGWSALVFSGQGIYRFCKYRLGFDREAISKLRSIKVRAEVAADTLQPQWRQLLSLVGASTQPLWHGHPHDWVVNKRQDPIPLATTYRQWDADFSFTHLEESILDCEKWGGFDPRRQNADSPHICDLCSKVQSTAGETNECSCFPTLFSSAARNPAPVQVFRTSNGRNNGLIACCSFERGAAVGEFTGRITKGLTDVDVMQNQAGPDNEPYQIWQGRHGNFTRFINHSCRPNCQFQAFGWLGVQRIIVVSKGVKAGDEVTVDYSERYWRHLDKVCLCGEMSCRCKSRRREG
jgi:SET domain